MTKARQLAEFASDHAMFRNLLYNGAMQINQRGNVSNSSGNAYGCDRWQIVRAGGVGNAVYDLKQSTDVPSGQPFKNSFHLDITTAETSIQNGGGYQFRQQLEGYDVQRLMKGTSSAKSLTLSFWVKSPKTGTHIVELYDVDNARQVSQSYTINSANTWQQVTVNFPADTTGSFDNDNNRSLLIQWWLAAGNNFTSGTLNTSWANNTDANRLVGQVNILDATNDWYITGIQLEEGTVATPFEHRPIGIELSLCQRYYQKSYDLSEKPGGATQYPTQGTHLGTYQGSEYVYSIFNSTYNQRLSTNIPIKTRMRSASGQTLKIYNPYNGDLNKVMQAGGGASYAVTIINYSEISPSFYATVTGNSAGNTVGDIYRYHWVVENEL
tara:strand:- start:349 stop:1494 length:1146 start_codon:yes stop_codon:yes gene_type:complete